MKSFRYINVQVERLGIFRRQVKSIGRTQVSFLVYKCMIGTLFSSFFNKFFTFLEVSRDVFLWNYASTINYFYDLRHQKPSPESSKDS